MRAQFVAGLRDRLAQEWSDRLAGRNDFVFHFVRPTPSHYGRPMCHVIVEQGRPIEGSLVPVLIEQSERRQRGDVNHERFATFVESPMSQVHLEDVAFRDFADEWKPPLLAASPHGQITRVGATDLRPGDFLQLWLDYRAGLNAEEAEEQALFQMPMPAIESTAPTWEADRTLQTRVIVPALDSFQTLLDSFRVLSPDAAIEVHAYGMQHGFVGFCTGHCLPIFESVETCLRSIWHDCYIGFSDLVVTPIAMPLAIHESVVLRS